MRYNENMRFNPAHNALLAIGYIVGIVGLGFLTSLFTPDIEGSIFMPMGMLSLLVLSVAVMAYLFFYRPIIMLLDGEREKAVAFFLQTVGIFAGATAVIFLITLVVSGVMR